MTSMLLNDERMQSFVRNGYLNLDCGLPAGFHRQLHKQIIDLYATEGNPGNDILPRVPDLHSVLRSQPVRGALRSLLGPDYLVHPHRHCHHNVAGSDGQRMHQDSYERDQNVRHHRVRWLMAFYYPQDVDANNGPSSIVPQTQFLTATDQNDSPAELPLHGAAGTVTIVHYDLWHRAMANVGNSDRFMVKFLFTRMAEPSSSDWAHGGSAWIPTGRTDDALCASVWDWYRGAASESSTTSDTEALCEQLKDDDEMVRYQAAYRLGVGKAVDPLVEALGAEAESRVPANIERAHTNPAQFDTAYGLTAAGAEAVPALTDLLGESNWALRASAADILGDMGPAATDGIGGLQQALTDESEWVRRNATEALGNIGPAARSANAALAERLTDDDVAVRHNAALALGKIGAAPQAALRTAMEDEDHYVCTLAADALRRLG